MKFQAKNLRQLLFCQPWYTP